MGDVVKAPVELMPRVRVRVRRGSRQDESLLDRLGIDQRASALSR